LNVSNRLYKLELLDGGSIEFNLLSAQTADNVYAAIQKFDDNPEYIEYLFNKLTNNRYKLDDLYAGVPSLVIYACLIKSGIVKDAPSLISIIESARDDIADNVYYTIYSTISSIFPQYKLEELKQKTVNELFELFAYSERVAGKQMFDTDKMKKSLTTDGRRVPVKTKGIASVTQDELDMLKSILSNEETSCGGMPNQGF
jgi:hypothetical protein